MVEPTNAFIEFSNSTAELVERAASCVVSVRGGGRWPTSGIHWRSGVIVTAEELLDGDENIRLILPGGREVAASLAGRDPTTDVAVLRFQPDGLPTAAIISSASRPGQTVIAVGSHEGTALAAFGIIAYAGGAWQSMRGGAIDSLIRLDLTLSPAAEGGAVVDSDGRDRDDSPRTEAASPGHSRSTIERSIDQLLARGRVFRGYLGAGLQTVRRAAASDGSQALNGGVSLS